MDIKKLLKNLLHKKQGMGTAGLKGFLILIIMAIITSAIWISQMDTIYGQVQQTDAHPYNVTFSNGTTTTFTSPEPFVQPDLLIQILGLVPLGLWVAVGFAGFKMFKS